MIRSGLNILGMATIPQSLKLITSALRRAEELEKDLNNKESKVSTCYLLFVIVYLKMDVIFFTLRCLLTSVDCTS